jgi:N-acetyl-alpha-D-glucosaminyl L-malate synthase BshA
VIHVSNFRPVKRIDAVMAVFARVLENLPAQLVLVGDGPELGTAYRLGRELGIADHVDAIGAQEAVIPLLSAADLFLLPSAQESFGLAALEAMACEVPVVASNVGGLPEVIDHGRSGFLHDPTDLDGMAASGVALLEDPRLHARIARTARDHVLDCFGVERIVPLYEDCYQRVLG